jgi:hypothetical protein
VRPPRRGCSRPRVQAQEVADEDLARAEAALAALRPRPLALPAAPAPGAYVDVKLSLRATQPIPDDALDHLLRLRLTSLGFAVVPLEIDAGLVKLTVPSVRATDVDTLVTAVTLGGHVRGATVPRGLESITAGDPRWTWRDLPIDHIVAETPDGAVTPDLTMVFTPDGAQALLELTTPKQALAITVDDRELTNAAVSEPLTAGQLRLSPRRRPRRGRADRRAEVPAAGPAARRGPPARPGRRQRLHRRGPLRDRVPRRLRPLVPRPARAAPPRPRSSSPTSRVSRASASAAPACASTARTSPPVARPSPG